MIVYLNRTPRVGPWGGANRLVNELVSCIESRGHTVTYDHSAKRIDSIFCFDPRPNQFGAGYELLLLLREMHHAPIIQRIGDLGTHGKPELTELVKATVQLSDFIIFPSKWARLKLEMIKISSSAVIFNRPAKMFYDGRINRCNDKKTRVVTHHWSDNPKKGFITYKLFDTECERLGLIFTFIGRKPSNIEFKNYIQPLDTADLIIELSKHDVYLTASEDEAGANHVLEALAVGLPIVYSASGGSIVDYCHDYGEAFTGVDCSAQVLKVINEYDERRNAVLSYHDDLSQTACEITDVLEEQACSR